MREIAVYIGGLFLAIAFVVGVFTMIKEYRVSEKALKEKRQKEDCTCNGGKCNCKS